MATRADVLKEMVRMIAATAEHELACEQCFEQIDRFVDMELAGMDVAQMMPLVERHLNLCRECRDEYEALLQALRSLDRQESE